MELIFVVFFFFLVPFFVASFTGGLAGAIQGRGREDRSLLANAGIGLVGWAVAWIVVTLVSGEQPSEITIGMGLLALLFSILFISFLERRRRKRSIESTADAG